MQNCYVGDVGDFGKYGLLRALSLSGSDASPALSLGVVWYLVPDEKKGNDGTYIDYLEEDAGQNGARLRRCDPSLYDALRRIVHSEQRGVLSVRTGGVLPVGTVFFEEPLIFAGMPHIGPAAREARLRHRTGWLQRALAAIAGCDVVFVDPDNGFESGTKRHHKRGPKYAYFDELAPYLLRGQSLVVYHHMARNRPASEQIRLRLSQIAERLRGRDAPFALRYHRGTARAFFVVPTKAHSALLLDRAKRFASGPWSAHFCPPRSI